MDRIDKTFIYFKRPALFDRVEPLDLAWFESKGVKLVKRIPRWRVPGMTEILMGKRKWLHLATSIFFH